ncbi:MAG: polymer-forming cytoskeletal protein [Actinobacteria bacterium]|nr:polymer-forming cytoskeletal protein [Actinomycetota bacterium]MBL7123529.1 polymer-forming cytoskeletal protein [Actinomycetota bacterium]
MFSKKDVETTGSKSLTIIAEGVIVEGKIRSRGSTRIDGKVDGDIVSQKDFIIGKEGKVKATVKTANAVIAGSFQGEMVASGEVEITSTGKFIGNLTQKDALLTVSKGGLFKGESIIAENEEVFKLNYADKSSDNVKESIEIKRPLRPENEIKEPLRPERVRI